MPALPPIHHDVPGRNHRMASPESLSPRHCGRATKSYSHCSMPAVPTHPTEKEPRHLASHLPNCAHKYRHMDSVRIQSPDVSECPPWPSELMRGQFRAPQPPQCPMNESQRGAPRQPRRRISGSHDPNSSPPNTPVRSSSSGRSYHHTDSSCSDSDFTPQAVSPRDGYPELQCASPSYLALTLGTMEVINKLKRKKTHIRYE